MFFSLLFFFLETSGSSKKLESGVTHKQEMYTMIKDVTLTAFPPPHLPSNPRTLDRRPCLAWIGNLKWNRNFRKSLQQNTSVKSLNMELFKGK